MRRLSNNSRGLNPEHSINEALSRLRTRADEFADAYQAGTLDFQEAVDRAQEFAETRGYVDVLGQDRVQWVLSCAFAGRSHT